MEGDSSVSRPQPPRSSKRWLSDVEAWVAERLALEDVVVIGALTEHLNQPWSSVWTIATNRGRLWFKENSAVPCEPSVHGALAALAPAYVDPPIAIDRSRGWSLTRDGGETMMACSSEPDGVASTNLIAMLRDYAQLQRSTVGHRQPLVDAGLRVLDPRDAANLARSLADELAGLDRDDPRHIRKDEYRQVVSALPALQEAGEVLAAGIVPLAFDHADLVSPNVFLPRRGGHHRFLDLADSAWGHPFCSLVMLAREYIRRWHIPQPDGVINLSDDRIHHVFDAYLEAWSDLASAPALRDLARHALRVAPLHRSSAWLRHLEACDDSELGAHGRAPWGWLRQTTRPVLL